MVLAQLKHLLTQFNHHTHIRLFRLLSLIRTICVRFGTLPYYRLYHFNTAAPISRIASIASDHPGSPRLLYAVTLWRARKLTELQFISIACAILAAAVIGAFSWTTIDQAYWLTHGFWHGSLVLSVLGLLIAAQQVTVLNFLGPMPSPKKIRQTKECLERYLPVLLSKDRSRYHPRQKMVFAWQCPLMFMSYSVCSFLAGITILVCTPLIQREGGWNDGCNIAVMYLSVCAIAGTTFVFCGFWIYHYVDLGFDEYHDGSDGEEADGSGNENGQSSRVVPAHVEMLSQPLSFVDSGHYSGFDAKRVNY
ncbi:hypothetical protein HBI56_180000 [Parastagonospora nodorum]|uniref:Uncharacterized protein n=1 Tax=Phaeosphaeria nodorum (strain SN15 / ATCC MYA-4574 / FGSC 10173) TaxID=321614 RepID=A0A7U2FBB9_PHANO|nr:hypothetical protein HBH56_185430 [Parastagonospora nodorum]QRD01104.1 hypothetical protein JI435_153010 [Parastagonospora nodorum SN15]KAH3925388.1 hypothetical protein HBH54_183130 [Parastagonospora nodorum]KAH3940556.1 hypothetical protein HBH53_214690 [Parastagonospora nodorum]KAH3958204.1 hypothetical protein HBH51_211690 [Parastagonospora nodorum]